MSGKLIQSHLNTLHLARKRITENVSDNKPRLSTSIIYQRPDQVICKVNDSATRTPQELLFGIIIIRFCKTLKYL